MPRRLEIARPDGRPGGGGGLPQPGRPPPAPGRRPAPRLRGRGRERARRRELGPRAHRRGGGRAAVQPGGRRLGEGVRVPRDGGAVGLRDRDRPAGGRPPRAQRLDRLQAEPAALSHPLSHLPAAGPADDPPGRPAQPPHPHRHARRRQRHRPAHRDPGRRRRPGRGSQLSAQALLGPRGGGPRLLRARPAAVLSRRPRRAGPTSSGASPTPGRWWRPSALAAGAAFDVAALQRSGTITRLFDRRLRLGWYVGVRKLGFRFRPQFRAGRHRPPAPARAGGRAWPSACAPELSIPGGRWSWRSRESWINRYRALERLGCLRRGGLPLRAGGALRLRRGADERAGRASSPAATRSRAGRSSGCASRRRPSRTSRTRSASRSGWGSSTVPPASPPCCSPAAAPRPPTRCRPRTPAAGCSSPARWSPPPSSSWTAMQTQARLVSDEWEVIDGLDRRRSADGAEAAPVRHGRVLGGHRPLGAGLPRPDHPRAGRPAGGDGQPAGRLPREPPPGLLHQALGLAGRGTCTGPWTPTSC